MIGISVAIISLITAVVTVVWAVAKIDKATSNLGVQIHYLTEEIKTLREDHKDHEARIRQIELKHRSCDHQ
jgi:Sec-independent protein translocase protein TatA